MYAKFAHKIKSPHELAALLGRRPRRRTVIMCHGTFDIVHPGHLRHLMYAKEKADVLVASVTADEHISKGPFRPYVPQELRAANLAALEFVDYVVIDRNATPVENIGIVQPDYFAKGFEYQSDPLPPKTAEEVRALEAYGGEMVFTPGDIVYSSTALLMQHGPRLGVDKAIALLQSEGVSFDDLRRTLGDLGRLRVHVVGDTIVDRYSYCSLLGQSAKAPCFSVRLEHTDVFVGGAAIVAKHVKSFGADVTFTTVLGDDELAGLVVRDLDEAKLRVRPLVDAARPTTLKERFIADGHRMLQVDRVDNRIVSDRIRRDIVESIRSTDVDVVIFSDFRHGIFHHATIDEYVTAIRPGVLKTADSQVSNRWGNILDFRDFDLITPNEREARFALGDQDSGVRPLAQRLFGDARCRYLVLKLGERGTLTYRSPGPLPREFFILDSFVDTLVDPIGGGDALVAVATLALAASGDIVRASVLGSLAAAVACERAGNVPVVAGEVAAKLDALERAAAGS
ncbi:MAG TPA: PfkB family carbohydrate kinase [Methylomirabilota bacterium]|jgi:rfaE bifunctional protein kinase chain/domain|nr:PfkB family carbohydrate kinase [Methylomirabilota bacterium]